jgi:hypothetical protein
MDVPDFGRREIVKHFRDPRQIALVPITPEPGACLEIGAKMAQGPFLEDHAKDRRALGDTHRLGEKRILGVSLRKVGGHLIDHRN